MTQIEISKRQLKRFIIVVISAFVFTFLIEHFSKTSWSYFPEERELYTMNITTLLGNNYEKEVRDWDIRFGVNDEGYWKPKITYLHKLPFYLMAVLKDVLIPISIIGLYSIYLLFKRYVKIVNPDPSHEKIEEVGVKQKEKPEITDTKIIFIILLSIAVVGLASMCK